MSPGADLVFQHFQMASAILSSPAAALIGVTITSGPVKGEIQPSDNALQPVRSIARSHLLYADLFFFSRSPTCTLPLCCFLKKTDVSFFSFLKLKTLGNVVLFCLEVTKNCYINFKSIVE